MQPVHRLLLLSEDAVLAARLRRLIGEKSAVSAQSRIAELTLVRSSEAAVVSIDAAVENARNYSLALIDASAFEASESDFVNQLWASQPNLHVIELSRRETSAELDERLAGCLHPALFQMLHHSVLHRELEHAIQRCLLQVELADQQIWLSHEVETLTAQIERLEHLHRDSKTELRTLRLSQLDQVARRSAFGGESSRDTLKRMNSGPAVRRITLKRSDAASATEPASRALPAGASLQRPARAARRDRSDAIRLSGRILVADDVPGNRRLMTFLLEQVGAQVVTAADGRDALQVFESARAAGETPDLILMDMLMPELNGYDCTRVLRRRGHHGPIVAVTARNEPADRQMCLRAGCDEYVTKPIDRNHLIQTIDRLLKQQAEASELA